MEISSNMVSLKGDVICDRPWGVHALLLQLGVAVVYMLLARVVDKYLPGDIASVFWPASGLALVVLLLGGRRYAWGVFLGALLAQLFVGSLWTSVLVALGSTLEGLCAAWLLSRNHKFDSQLHALHDYTRLVFWGGCVAGLLGAAIGPTALLIAGSFTSANYMIRTLQWWMGDVLGVVLVAPLLLVWRNFPVDWLSWKRQVEVAVLLILTVLAGQIIFLGWLPGIVGQFDRGFLMFLFVAWAAVRLGMHGVLLLLVVITSQSLLGAYGHVGVFRDDIDQTQLIGLWSYIVTLSLVGMLLACYISAEKRDKLSLRKQEKFFHLIADNIDDFIMVLDLQGRRIYNNSAYVKLFGAESVSKGLDCFNVIHPDDRSHVHRVLKEIIATGISKQVECRFMLPDGTIRLMESRGELISDSADAKQVVVVSHDITKRKRAEEEIHNLAFYDALTGLPNRRLLDDRLVQAIATNKRTGRLGAVIFLDLNNFKPLNDAYGHAAGDMLLVEAAKRIGHCVREADTVARFGGDEFVVVLTALDEDREQSARETRQIAEKVRKALAVPYKLELSSELGGGLMVEHRSTASLGCLLFEGHENSQERLINCADLAMYQAKRNGRDQICFPDSCDAIREDSSIDASRCHAQVCPRMTTSNNIAVNFA